jgi:hypothetical protein
MSQAEKIQAVLVEIANAADEIATRAGMKANGFEIGLSAPGVFEARFLLEGQPVIEGSAQQEG